MTIRDSLAQVQELLGRAAPGEWWVDQERRVYNAEAYVCDANIRHTEYDNEATANAIAAAVNWLREHGPELMKRLDRHGAGDAEDAIAVLAAMNDGYTVRKGLPSSYLTDEANAERTWIVERALPPFCDEKGVGLWHASTPLEAIAKARAAIDAARAGERGVSGG